MQSIGDCYEVISSVYMVKAASSKCIPKVYSRPGTIELAAIERVREAGSE